jgi:hypothetical protein
VPDSSQQQRQAIHSNVYLPNTTESRKGVTIAKNTIDRRIHQPTAHTLQPPKIKFDHNITKPQKKVDIRDL